VKKIKAIKLITAKKYRTFPNIWSTIITSTKYQQ